MKLTVGIPTQGKRPERTVQAIRSALEQAVPVAVVVACQGDDEGLGTLRKAFNRQRRVRFIPSPARCLWENWTFAAEQCETALFAWLQDDDLLQRQFSRRVLAAFDSAPEASCYLGRLSVTYGNSPLGCWWQGCGPWLPMDLMTGRFVNMHPALLAVGAYVASHTLSPAFAFRHTTEAMRAIRRLPTDSDLFMERLVPAALSRFGPAVCDPAIVGYWVHHGDNESFRLNPIPGEAHAEYRSMCRALDPIVRRHRGWQDVFRAWCQMVGLPMARGWIEQLSPLRDASKLLCEALAIVLDVYPALAKGA